MGRGLLKHKSSLLSAAHKWAEGQAQRVYDEWVTRKNREMLVYGSFGLVATTVVAACLWSGIAAFIGFGALGVFVAACLHKNVKDATDKVCAQHFPTEGALVQKFFDDHIRSERRRFLGDEAPLIVLLQRLEGMYAEAQVLSHELNRRWSAHMADTNEDELVSVGRADALEADRILKEELDSLRPKIDTIRAYFTAIEERVRESFHPGSSLQLALRARALRAEAEGARVAADALIARTLDELYKSTVTIGLKLEEALISAGVAAAVQLPASGSFERDFGNMRGTIRAFVKQAQRIELESNLDLMARR